MQLKVILDGNAMVLRDMMVVPRVISEVKKTGDRECDSQHSKPKIAGQLSWLVQDRWLLRYVEIRQGILLLYDKSKTAPEFRLALRHLNLQPGEHPKSFMLGRVQARPLITFQAASQLEYERWVKTLAVELLRQTPLEAVRFLDILGITATLREHNQSNCRSRTRSRNARHSVSDSDDEDRDFEELMIRCQQVDNYVPVKEKRRLFESLCRREHRLAQSTDNLYMADMNRNSPVRHSKKRAHSLHDLSRGTIAVKEMCRYFEEQVQKTVSENVLNEDCNKESNVSSDHRKVRRWERRLLRLKQQVERGEDKMWRLQEEIALLDKKRNGHIRTNNEDLKECSELEKHLSDEEKENIIIIKGNTPTSIRKIQHFTEVHDIAVAAH